MLHVTENTVNPTPATRERFVAPDFTSGAQALARGAENLAQGASEATQNLDKIGEEYDTAAVKQADAEDIRQIAEVRANVLSSKGFDTQQAIADARQKIEEIRKSRISSLNNSRQRRMYADVFDQRNIQLEESFATHSATQIAEANQNASLARAESYTDMAVDTFGTKAFDDNLGTALNEVASANRGQAPDAIARKQASVKSQILSRAISGMIADPDQADHAKLALDQHAADILPEDEEKLRRMLNPILQENRTDADAGWAFTNDQAPGSRTTDPLAPIDEHSSEKPETAPRPAVATNAPKPASYATISPADPLRGKGRITDNAAAHRARGSGNALDIAAPAGTAIYPPMSGKVVKSWWDQKGGWSVLVEHPNGYVTGYAHLRSKSPYGEGQEVDATTPIGSVGATGDATGPHVHYTVRESRGGPKVDPSAALWDSKGTVKPDGVKWKEAEPVKYDAEENQLGRALSRLHDRAAAENWSPQRYNKAVDRVRQISGVQEQLYNKQQEDRYDAAISTVVGLDTKFTSVSQIPGFGLLKPTQQYSLQQIAEANRKSGVAANGPRFLMLMGMAQSPEYRQQFLGADLGQETDITPGERAQLWNYQLKLKQEPNGALAANLNTVDQYANRYLPKTTYKGQEGEIKRRAFSDRMAAAIERQQNELGRPLTTRETDDVARSLTVQVVRPGGDEAMGFEVLGSGKGGNVNVPQTFNAIAPDIRQRIVDDLARQGKPHSMKDVVAEWLASRSR